MTSFIGIACALLVTAAGVHDRRGRARPASTPCASDFDETSADPQVSEQRHDLDREAFDKIDVVVPDGLGPVYNAQSCRECHQNPISGAASQITEHRAGHRREDGQFVNPKIPINDGKPPPISGRNLINDRAICPCAQENVPDRGEPVRTTRLSLSVLGDGFIEAIPDATLVKIRDDQCNAEKADGVCGSVIWVPVLETNSSGGVPVREVGRFGWKDQHASILSFSADAYLNEMGITNRLQPTEVTLVCNPPVRDAGSPNDGGTVTEPNDQPGADEGAGGGQAPPDGGLEEDIDRFARFIRSTRPPPRDAVLAGTHDALQGAAIFKKIRCSACHFADPITTGSGMIHGNKFQIPPALAKKQIQPFSDFLLHDIGTGDEVPISGVEQYGEDVASKMHLEDKLKMELLRSPAGEKGSPRTLLEQRRAEWTPKPERVQQLEHDIAQAHLKDERYSAPDECPGFPTPADARPFFQRDRCEPHFLQQTETSADNSIFTCSVQCTANKLRTPPLWGLRVRSRLMHDGQSVTITDAIRRHAGEAKAAELRFEGLSQTERDQLLTFLKSL